jgi:hypothetical protein
VRASRALLVFGLLAKYRGDVAMPDLLPGLTGLPEVEVRRAVRWPGQGRLYVTSTLRANRSSRRASPPGGGPSLVIASKSVERRSIAVRSVLG